MGWKHPAAATRGSLLNAPRMCVHEALAQALRRAGGGGSGASSATSLVPGAPSAKFEYPVPANTTPPTTEGPHALDAPSS